MNKNIKNASLITIIAISIFLAFRKFFLRQPDRNIPNDNSKLISPANGKIIAVREFDYTGMPDSYITEFKDSTIPGAVRILTSDVSAKGYIISIALNLTNVHYQRAPADSVIIKKTYSPGSFNNALRYDNEDFFRHENEHNEILLSANVGSFKYKVVQIAGFIARMIEDYVVVGQNVKQGDVIGLIKFGSQVTVVVPYNLNILVKAGDIVVDGETPIASLIQSL